MRNARKILGLGFAAVALAGCGSKGDRQTADQNMAMDDGMPNGQIPANAAIETLPADESSATPSNQLVNGEDAPEVNDLNSATAN